MKQLAVGHWDLQRRYPLTVFNGLAITVRVYLKVIVV